MKQNLRFLLALGDAKMIVLDSPARQEVYAIQRTQKAEQENSLRRIAEALTAK